MGFITCLNGSKAHNTCSLIFCDSREYNEISNSGLGEIRPNQITFIDTNNINPALVPENVPGFFPDDIDYVNWMANCLAGNASSSDKEILKKIDEQELLLTQRAVPFALLSKMFKLVVTQISNRVNANESTSRALGIAAFSLLKQIETNLPASRDKLLPFISNQLDHVILKRYADMLICDIDNQLPDLIDKLMPHLSADVQKHINDVRIIRAPLDVLLAKCNDKTPQYLLPLIVEGAKQKYQKNIYKPNEITYGYEIGVFALRKSSDISVVADGCRELFSHVFAATDAAGVHVFANTNSIENMLEALLAMKLAKGSATIKDCDRIFTDIISKTNEQPQSIMRRLIQNARSIPTSAQSDGLSAIELSYVGKVCVEGGYDTSNLIQFCNYLKPKEQYSDLWSIAVTTCAPQQLPLPPQRLLLRPVLLHPQILLKPPHHLLQRLQQL